MPEWRLVSSRRVRGVHRTRRAERSEVDVPAPRLRWHDVAPAGGLGAVRVGVGVGAGRGNAGAGEDPGLDPQGEEPQVAEHAKASSDVPEIPESHREYCADAGAGEEGAGEEEETGVVRVTEARGVRFYSLRGRECDSDFARTTTLVLRGLVRQFSKVGVGRAPRFPSSRRSLPSARARWCRLGIDRAVKLTEMEDAMRVRPGDETTSGKRQMCHHPGLPSETRPKHALFHLAPRANPILRSPLITLSPRAPRHRNTGRRSSPRRTTLRAWIRRTRPAWWTIWI